jgi:hypothetical protein
VVTLAISCFAAAPLSASANEYQEENIEINEISASEVVNSEIILMAEEIKSKEVITDFVCFLNEQEEK